MYAMTNSFLLRRYSVRTDHLELDIDCFENIKNKSKHLPAIDRSKNNDGNFSSTLCSPIRAINGA
jgi:hypothetical protein